MSDSLPSRLRELHEAYEHSGGSYLMQGPRLTEKWLKIAGSSSSVRDHISRQSILTEWRTASDEVTTTRALSLTMFWGYGSMRFGRRNTKLARDSIRGGKWRQLLDIRAVATSDATQAFADLSSLRIKGLGMAFQSKILYGMTGSIPILDRHTRRWLNHYGLQEVSAQKANLVVFDCYYKLCTSWAKAPIGSEGKTIGDPCLIEYLMFWDAKRGRKHTAKESPTWLLRVAPWRK